MQKGETNNTDDGGDSFLRERDLATRWKVSGRTLQRWRSEGYGPRFFHIGGGIRYRLTDVVEYEGREFSGGRVDRDGS